MKLNKIRQSIDSWINQTQSLSDLKEISSYLNQFSTHWTFETPDFLGMFDRSVNQALFKIYYPDRDLPFKKVMLAMIDQNPVALRQMFLDLFYERVDLRSRVEHFILECDENFRKLTNQVTPPHSNHLHQDFRTLSTYLFLNNPEKYSYINYLQLQTYLAHVEARSIPDKFDFENQIKSISIINKIAHSDSDIKAKLNQIDPQLTNTNIVASEVIRKFKSN